MRTNDLDLIRVDRQLPQRLIEPFRDQKNEGAAPRINSTDIEWFCPASIKGIGITVARARMMFEPDMPPERQEIITDALAGRAYSVAETLHLWDNVMIDPELAKIARYKGRVLPADLDRIVLRVRDDRNKLTHSRLTDRDVDGLLFDYPYLSREEFVLVDKVYRYRPVREWPRHGLATRQFMANNSYSVSDATKPGENVLATVSCKMIDNEMVYQVGARVYNNDNDQTLRTWNASSLDEALQFIAAEIRE